MSWKNMWPCKELETYSGCTPAFNPAQTNLKRAGIYSTEEAVIDYGGQCKIFAKKQLFQLHMVALFFFSNLSHFCSCIR